MEEYVALDSNKQKQFVKSIKGIKKLIKKNDAVIKSGDNSSITTKDDGIKKKRRKERGLVYLSHIPHGFYENEMTQYFKQFGVVTNVRVIRSKRTGNSKGHAFVEFREPAVGQIVAETMNNYLMGKRLIKAAYIPPEKQRRNALRKHWSAVNNPGTDLRIKLKKAYNTNKDDKGELQRAKKILSNLSKTKKKLSELGINYAFFTPVDIPEALIYKEEVKIETNDCKENITTANNDKKSKRKNKKVESQDNGNKVSLKETKDIKCKNVQVVEVKQKGADKVTKGKEEKNKKDAKMLETNLNKKQKQKNKLGASVKPLENFIKIQQDSDNESDSTYAFDSDEYEKMVEHEDDLPSDNDANDSDNEESDEEKDSDDDSVEVVAPKKRKGNPTPKIKQPNISQNQIKLRKNAHKKDLTKKLTQQMKKKSLQKVAASPKLKFEKQNAQNPRSKQFKKKK